MATDLPGHYSTNSFDADMMGQAVDNMMRRSADMRRVFERRWYDNNFFDDGFHFRYLSRTQNKIVDLADRSTIFAPLRAIPKASRQIRGIANLLMSQDYIPVIYPEKVNFNAFPPLEQQDPESGEFVTQPNPQYKAALDEAKKIARGTGHWVQEEYKKQELTEKLALMVLLAAKHGISYLQVWPDAVEEEIKTEVFDAFDVYVLGTVNELDDSPYLIKTKPRLIAAIKADERFKPEKTAKISPDNKQASSEIKDAYMRARHGGVAHPDSVARLIEKEAFVKEYIDDDSFGRIKMQKNGGDILRNREKGDPVIRHTFVAGNVTLLDEYLTIPGYPLVDFRFEPGPLYQVPLIERFIPANKSLDLISSRIERYTHTMVTGSWSKRQGEQFDIDNTAGGQIIEYQATPPVQNQVVPLPNFLFNFMDVLTGFIEEQGVTTTTLGKVPQGVKAAAAIESLKESEFANLVISNRQLKGTVRRISQKFLDLADDFFMTPQTVQFLDQGEPQYFDVIGSSAIEKRDSVGVETPGDVVPIKKDYRVDIEVQSGLGYTKESRKAAAKELGDYMIQLVQMGVLSEDGLKPYIDMILKAFEFGPTQEIMESFEQFKGEGSMSKRQLDAMKLSIIEVFEQLQKEGILPTSQQRISETKVGVAETVEALGGGGGAGGQGQQQEEKPPSRSIPFKDLPPEGKVQLAAQAGIDISAEEARRAAKEGQKQESNK